MECNFGQSPYLAAYRSFFRSSAPPLCATRRSEVDGASRCRICALLRYGASLALIRVNSVKTSPSSPFDFCKKAEVAFEHQRFYRLPGPHRKVAINIARSIAVSKFLSFILLNLKKSTTRICEMKVCAVCADGRDYRFANTKRIVASSPGWLQAITKPSPDLTIRGKSIEPAAVLWVITCGAPQPEPGCA